MSSNPRFSCFPYNFASHLKIFVYIYIYSNVEVRALVYLRGWEDVIPAIRLGQRLICLSVQERIYHSSLNLDQARDIAATAIEWTFPLPGNSMLVGRSVAWHLHVSVGSGLRFPRTCWIESEISMHLLELLQLSYSRDWAETEVGVERELQWLRFSSFLTSAWEGDVNWTSITMLRFMLRDGRCGLAAETEILKTKHS